jgi:hypothetical protein
MLLPYLKRGYNNKKENEAHIGGDMLVTFGATFFGVIASFLLWFGGQWWIKHRHDQKAVKNIIREINEEIALNINILVGFIGSTPKIISEGNIPFYIPHRMNLSAYHYFSSSVESRLLDVSIQRWILNAGIQCEHFNNFINNTEVLLTSLLAQPNGLQYAIKRLEMLVEQAKETAKNLKEILEKLKASEDKYAKEKPIKINQHTPFSFAKKEFLTTGILFFLFSITLYIYHGSPFTFSVGGFNWTAPEIVSTIVNWLVIIVLIVGSIISIFCLFGSYSPQKANNILNMLARYEKLMRRARDVFIVIFPFAFLLNFYASWVQKLVGVAKDEIVFFIVFAIGLIWTWAIIQSQERRRSYRWLSSLKQAVAFPFKHKT